MKKALITGITGQDGAYLAKFLLDKGYTVYGSYRRTAATNFWRIEELRLRNNPNLCLVEHDLSDLGSNVRLIEKTQPDGSESLIDVSGLFDESSQVRVPLDKLCESFLGLKYKRSKNKPHAFTECKVAMALYQKWKEIKGVASKPLTVVDSNIQVQKKDQILMESHTVEN